MVTSVVRGNDLYFPQGNEHGDYYEPLFIARQDEQKAHGRTPAEAIENLERQIDSNKN